MSTKPFEIILFLRNISNGLNTILFTLKMMIIKHNLEGKKKWDKIAKAIEFQNKNLFGASENRFFGKTKKVNDSKKGSRRST